MIKIVRAEGSAEFELIAALRARAAEVGASINESAASIMQDIRTRGYEAVREYSLKFDGAEPYEINREAVKEAYARCPAELISAMERSAENIWDYQARLLSKTKEWQSAQGGIVGQLVRGLTRVGVYVPGGTAAYPSSVLMNIIPAKVAGVGEVIMVTPPTENLNDAVLAAAKIAGADRVIAVGGVQAVGALVYGAGFIPAVDKLVGPGNAYVAAAKRLAFGMIDIDMIAGPSEVLIIADDTANPAYIAADMLSQAEHDVLASAILVTTSMDLAQRVAVEIDRQTERLERMEIINRSISDFGAVIVCNDIEEAAKISDTVAPEHLEIMTATPRQVLQLVKNAGAVFLGENSPEPLGDYMAGPSHVLPTSGTARFFSPLSVDSFLKRTSVIEYSRDALREVWKDIYVFANSEGLSAHANSIKIRFDEEGRNEKDGGYKSGNQRN